MAKTKKMNESAFAKIVREVNAVGETIKTYQDEKQSVMNDFIREKKRFISGKISRATLASSAKKANKEIKVLDRDIRKAIKRVGVIVGQAKEFVSKQVPKTIRASLAGVRAPKKKIKKKVKKARKKVRKKVKRVKKAIRRKVKRVKKAIRRIKKR